MPQPMQNSRKEVSITIMRKNVIKISAIALLSAFALTACDDEIIAKPTGYDDNSPVVNVGADVYNNNFKEIYDSIRSGTLPADVLDELLYQYSVSVFGSYNQVTLGKKTSGLEETITLKQAVNSYKNGDKADANKFIKAHSAYWTKNKSGKRVNDQYNEVAEDADASDSEYARLEEKWNTIEKRIAKKLYSSISGGSYSERNIFSEKRFLHSLASSIENKVKDVNATGIKLFEGILTPDVEDEDVFTKPTIEGNADSVILHRENYQGNADLTANETKDEEVTYVEDHLIPDIYRQLLVEQYILDESYDTLGRTAARHISVLSISKNTNYAKGAVDLMNEFVKNTVFDAARTTEINLDTFKMVSRAWNGTFMSADTYGTTAEYALLHAAVPDYEKTYDGFDIDGNPHTYHYFQGTAYGDMIEEIKKINDNPALSENESAYTGNNAYTKETGMKIKTDELNLIDHTSTGWYVKSVGVSALPDSIKNQLFDINVANALSGEAKEACVEYTVDGGQFKCKEYDQKQGDLINVVGKITTTNGISQYFLRNTTKVKDIPFQNDILFESDGTYYIILVEDATRSKNLDPSYYGGDTGRSYDTLESYKNEIVQIVADNDTYKTLSKKHWVEKMDLKYHDQAIYDYFKSNFPDLFEDEDE